jgi:hypothetical protein
MSLDDKTNKRIKTIARPGSIYAKPNIKDANRINKGKTKRKKRKQKRLYLPLPCRTIRTV